MQSLDQIRVSFYKNVYSKSPEQVSLISLLEAIVKGRYAESVNPIRRYYSQGDKSAAQKLKSALPCFTPSGTFNGGHSAGNFLEHSGIICIDYDHVADRETLLHLCREDSHTVSVFESPTDGLKVMAHVENASGRHLEAVGLVSRYYDRLLGLVCDAACKDESRLCYVSYSAHGYIAALYESFRLPDVLPGPAQNVLLPVSPLCDEESSPGSLLSAEEVTHFITSYLFLNPSRPGERNTSLFKMACEACKRRIDKNTLYAGICSRLREEDFDEQEIRRTLESGYKKVNSSVNENSYPNGKRTSMDKMTKCHYMPLSMENAGEEGYWSGEELRRSTPFIPDIVYENIPNQLKDCILEKCSARERDLLLLSCLGAFSAMLPQTLGVYDHRLFSPHLYIFCLAPAGSGKGVVQWGAKLLEVLNQTILDESEILQDQYKKQHAQWQSACFRQSKDKENSEQQEEPKQPPYKCLLIPATTSCTRMQLQLRDNGSLGGIIFDTEAQTMSDANRQDYGHFDGMLCKAFGHEMISSSYKANGMKPIVIHHPRLAVFLTGTPDQLNHLIENTENGLSSRFLFYTYRQPPVWKEMGREDDYDMEEYFAHYASQAYKLYLFCQAHPVRFSFTKNQWNRLNKTFSRLLSEVVSENSDNLQAVVKRYAFITLRIAMIFSRMDQYQRQSAESGLICSDTHFQAALDIVLCCYEHSRLLFTSIPTKPRYALKDPDEKRRFFDELPQSFTTEDVSHVAVHYSFSQRTAMRYIIQLIGLKVNKIAHGLYQKTVK